MSKLLSTHYTDSALVVVEEKILGVNTLLFNYLILVEEMMVKLSLIIEQ